MHRHRGHGSTVIAGSLVVAATSMLIISASGRTARAAGGSCGDPPEVLIVLDRSGSMAELVGSESKWKSATSAVKQLAGGFTTQLKMGLMLLPKWPDADSCSAGKVNVAPKFGSDASIGSLLAGSYPKGDTPIAASLDVALTALKDSTASTPPRVVLVTDGKETCRSAPAPLTQPGKCAWESGTNYRKCGGCGWQFCLKSGVWSSACEPAPTVYTCNAGQTCGKDALCKGAASGSATPEQAAAKLLALGIKTYVVGFGAEIDAAALTAIAKAGGTAGYQQADNLAQLNDALKAIAKEISCCGNGAIDAGELCDEGIAAGQLGACPAQCDDGDPCTVDTKVGDGCTAACSNTPITAIADGDGCCPTGASSATDSDCKASCGNGVLDSGESCDPLIPADQPGACVADCDDGDPCTVDKLGGNACNPSCTHAAASADPAAADGCCPAGLTRDKDADCKPACDADITTDCVDTCQTVTCPDGQFCKFGRCEPWPVDTGNEVAPPAGCDCDASPGAGAGSALLMLLLLLPFRLGCSLRRRRGRARRS